MSWQSFGLDCATHHIVRVTSVAAVVLLACNSSSRAEEGTKATPPPQPPAVVSPAPGSEPAAPTALGADHTGWNLNGEPLRYYISAGAPTCRHDCENDMACLAYSWVRPDGYGPGEPPMCYLLRSYTDAAQDDCCITATRGPFPGE